MMDGSQVRHYTACVVDPRRLALLWVVRSSTPASKLRRSSSPLSAMIDDRLEAERERGKRREMEEGGKVGAEE